MSELTQPLRLAVGSHEAGSGKGCGMNVISWENGDQQITDFPNCADPFLARIVQIFNDTWCDHVVHSPVHPERGLLCAPCSVEVLDLAHRTVGTRTNRMKPRRRVYVRLAVDETRRLSMPAGRQVRALTEELLVPAEAWLEGAVDLGTLTRLGFRDGKDEPKVMAGYALRAAAAAALGQHELCREDAVRSWAVTIQRLDGLNEAHRLFDEFTRLAQLEPAPAPALDLIDLAIARMLAREETRTP